MILSDPVPKRGNHVVGALDLNLVIDAAVPSRKKSVALRKALAIVRNQETGNVVSESVAARRKGTVNRKETVQRTANL